MVVRWPWLFGAATIASITLLALSGAGLASVGIFIDLALIPGVVRWGEPARDAGGDHWIATTAGVPMLDNVHNEERIHPEWQHLEAGDFIRAAQPGYLGGRFGDLGWRVTSILPGRALVLGNRGAFVLQRVDSRTTRFFVRTRGEGAATLASVVLGPISTFVFEPAHFIMQRRMMLGIRDRAERLMSS